MKFSTALLIILSHSYAFAKEGNGKHTFASETETPSSSDDTTTLTSTTTEELYTTVTSSFLASGTVYSSCYFTTTCDEGGTTVIKTVECSETSVSASSISYSEVPYTSIPSSGSPCYITTTCDEEGTPVTKIVECSQTSETPVTSSKAPHTPITSSKVPYTSIPSNSSSCYFTTTCDEEGTPVTKIVECSETPQTSVISSKVSTTALSTSVLSFTVPANSTSCFFTTTCDEEGTPVTKIIECLQTSETSITFSNVPTTEIPTPSPLFSIPANFTTSILSTTALTEISTAKNQTHSIITFEGVANGNSGGISVYLYGLIPLLLI